MAEELEKTRISGSVQTATSAGYIGGVSSFLDDDDTPVVVLAVMPKGDEDGDDLWLHVGDTFDLGEETWRVDEINPNHVPRWSTHLTRIR